MKFRKRGNQLILPFMGKEFVYADTRMGFSAMVSDWNNWRSK